MEKKTREGLEALIRETHPEIKPEQMDGLLVKIDTAIQEALTQPSSQ